MMFSSLNLLLLKKEKFPRYESLQTFKQTVLFIRVLEQLTFYDFFLSHITDSCLRSLVWLQCRNGLVCYKSMKRAWKKKKKNQDISKQIRNMN